MRPTLYKLAEMFMPANLDLIPDHAYVSFLKILIVEKDKITEQSVSQYTNQYHDNYFIELLKDKVIQPIPANKK